MAATTNKRGRNKLQKSTTNVNLISSYFTTDAKAQMRDIFKDLVNTLTTNEVDEGEMILVLKKKYRPDAGGGAYRDTGGGGWNGSRASSETPGREASNMATGDGRSGCVQSRVGSAGAMSTSDTQLSVSGGSAVSLFMGSSINDSTSLGSTMSTSSVSSETGGEEDTNLSVMSVKEHAKHLNKIKSESELQQATVSPLGLARRKRDTKRSSETGGEEDTNLSVMSVKERVKHLNKIKSESELQHATVSSLGLAMRKQDTQRMEPIEKEWLVASSAADYQPMHQSPSKHPELAKVKNNPGQGTGDGVFRKERYFSCQPESAVFVGIHRIRKSKNCPVKPPRKCSPEGAEGGSYSRYSDASDKGGLVVGSRIVWMSDAGAECGVVKWIGILPDARLGDVTVGVEFDNPVGTGTGKYKDIRLFQATQGHASLVPILGLLKEEEFYPDRKQERFQRLSQASDHGPSSESSDSDNSTHSSLGHAPENVARAKPGLAGAESGGVPVLEVEATHGDKKVLLEKKRDRAPTDVEGAGDDRAHGLPLEDHGSGPGTEAQKPGDKSPTPKSLQRLRQRFQRLSQASDHGPSSDSSDSDNSTHSSLGHAPENVVRAKPGLAGAESGGVPVLEAEATHGDKKVLLEKKRARAPTDVEGAGDDRASGLPLKGLRSGPGTEAQKPGDKRCTPKSLQRLRQPSDHGPSSDSSGSYNSAHSSLGHVPENVEGAKPGLAVAESEGVPVLEAEATHGDKNFGMVTTFDEAIEHINLQRAQEQMRLDGRDYISFIKTVERAGFSMAEVEIAVDRSIDHHANPFDWLANTWQQMIDMVVVNATEVGWAAEQNDVGEMSSAEAKAALIESKGNVDDATVRCVSQRQDTFADLSGWGVYKQEDILTALHQHGWARGPALNQLNQGLLAGYMERMWLPCNAAIPDPVMVEMNQSVANSVVKHDDFQQVVCDVHVDLERRIRMMFVEGKLRSWGHAETVISILDSHVTKATGAGGDPPLECSLEDIIEAVRNCGDRKSSLVYLQQECGTCYALYPMTKIQNLGCCNCKLCAACVKQYFEVVVRERHVRNWGCPLCHAPDLEDDDAATQYFELLQLILRTVMDEEIMNLLDTKLRDWHLQKDPNFRWCAHCVAGFLWEPPDILKMTCQTCLQKTCFLCKIKWEDQHEGHSCEQFQQWKFENDADTQAAGLARHLQENGIDCPSCKMRYALAKGGCMHFTCPECGHEFCSGCSQPFFKPGVCKLRKLCVDKGLHGHHPRDCFYYLRDNSHADLQKLLQRDGIKYNTKPPALQADKSHCPVMEQKEHGTAMSDKLCGLDTRRGTAGLCELHYKEYLVGLLNRNKIDPVAIMGLKEMKILLKRCDLAIPNVQSSESKRQYKKRLLKFIQENIPLTR